MKTVSNKINLAVILSLVLITASSTSVMAIENTVGNGTTQKAALTCDRMTTLKSSNEKTIAAQIKSLESVFTGRLSKISADEAAIDKKVESTRLTTENLFSEKIQTMLSQPGLTESQIKAINDYKVAMQQAESTRRSTIDSARTTYRAELLNLVTTKQQELTKSVDAYKATVLSALVAAKTNCGDGTAAATLRSSIKTARETLDASRAANKINTSVKQIATSRNNTIKQANETFKTAATEYAKTLTSALESTTTDTAN